MTRDEAMTEGEALSGLELEVRRIGGVLFVAFQDRGDALIVHVEVHEGRDITDVRLAVERLCRAYIERPVMIELAGGTRTSRVRLLGVETMDERDEVAVRLAFDGIQTVGRAVGMDPSATASATVDALERLGAEVPFEVKAAALFEHEVGEGVMLVLGSDRIGERYGVAAAPTIPQAAARATLHALNRHLAAQAFRTVGV